MQQHEEQEQLLASAAPMRIRAVAVETSQPTEVTGLRVFLFTSSADGVEPGRRLFVLINLSVKHDFAVRLPTTSEAMAAVDDRQEWHFRGAPDETSTDITINGKHMELDLPPGRKPPAGLWDLAELAVSAADDEPVAVQPASIVFVRSS